MTPQMETKETGNTEQSFSFELPKEQMDELRKQLQNEFMANPFVIMKFDNDEQPKITPIKMLPEQPNVYFKLIDERIVNTYEHQLHHNVILKIEHIEGFTNYWKRECEDEQCDYGCHEVEDNEGCVQTRL